MTADQARARAHALAYVVNALDGLMEMSDYDAQMMPWPREEHETVQREVMRIRDGLKARLTKARQ